MQESTPRTPAHASGGAARLSARAGDAFKIAVEAYLWGYPLVLMERTKKLLTNESQRGSAPLNTLRHRARLATPRDREVVKPNNDTLYSIAWLDLSRGPQILGVPEAGERYYSFQFMDAYTNTWAYVGSRATGTEAGRYVIAGPQWQGELPDLPVLTSPTNTVWLLGRTIIDGEDDLEAASDLMSQYRLDPLDGHDTAARWSDGPVLSPHDIGAGGIAFFDELGAALELSPPPPEDAALLETFASLGIGPGRTPSYDTQDSVIRLALDQAVTFGDRLLESRRSKPKRDGRGSGWSYALDLGDYGQNHLLRAVVARHGLGALTAKEAVYASTRVDVAGHPLTGKDTYRLHFPADRLPPVDAFWSLTAYDEENFLIENPIDRFALGDRTPGLTHAGDGSLDILIQHQEPPTGPSNWLPVPSGPFELTLRFYQPQAAMLEGHYTLPPIERR